MKMSTGKAIRYGAVEVSGSTVDWSGVTSDPVSACVAAYEATGGDLFGAFHWVMADLPRNFKDLDMKRISEAGTLLAFQIWELAPDFEHDDSMHVPYSFLEKHAGNKFVGIGIPTTPLNAAKAEAIVAAILKQVAENPHPDSPVPERVKAVLTDPAAAKVLYDLDWVIRISDGRIEINSPLVEEYAGDLAHFVHTALAEAGMPHLTNWSGGFANGPLFIVSAAQSPNPFYPAQTLAMLPDATPLTPGKT